MDIKQFTRELLEEKPLDTAVIGTVTHAIRITLYDPAFPPTWLLQHETNDALYSDVFITRDPKLADIREGDTLMFHKIAPEKEGHPFFLYASSIPVVPVTPPTPPPPVTITKELPKIRPEDIESPDASTYDFDEPDPPKQFYAEEKDSQNGEV